MKRKTAVKKIMSYGIRRNVANRILRKKPDGFPNRVAVKVSRAVCAAYMIAGVLAAFCRAGVSR